MGMSKKGFTLIELVMVIVIIGILAAVAIPKFISLRNDARRAVCQSNVGALRTALSNYYAAYNIGSYAGTVGPNGTVASAAGFPERSELNNQTSLFAQHFFAEGKLPNNTSFTNDSITNWGAAAVYNNTSGVIDQDTCCP